MKKGKVKRPLVIAMKGHPCSGKSTLAQSLANTLKFPLLSQDDAYHCIGNRVPESLHLLSSNITAAEHLNHLSFKIICRVASTQLLLGHSLIIDSSLQCRSHLDILLQLSTSAKARLIIVECNPKDRYEWRQRVERRVEVAGTITSLFKPSTWDQVLQLQEYSYDTEVSKLVVDTTDYVMDRSLADAVRYLADCRGKHSLDFLDHHDQWVIGNGLMKPLKVDGDEGEGEGEEEGEEQEYDEENLEVHYHELQLSNNQKDDDQEVLSCRGCLEPIYDLDYYQCNSCDLSIHSLCAELPQKKEILPRNFPLFLLGVPQEYSFPQVHRCSNCESKTESTNFQSSTESRNCESGTENENCEDENCESSNESRNCESGTESSGDDDPFDSCQECLFETNLRCALLPSFLVHDCHQHPLHIMIDPFCFFVEFQCKACGDPGEHARYNCSECGFEYHLSCALLPHTFKQENHKHPLTLTSSFLNDDDSREVFCYACEEKRNPNHWTYFCAESGCDFICHLNCMSFE